MRTLTQPAMTAGLAHGSIHVVRVRHRAHSGVALTVDEALFTRAETQGHIALVATNDLGIGPSRARDSPALADLHLDVVHDRAHRNARQRHRVTGLHVNLVARNHLVASGQPLGRNDIGLLAIRITDQGDKGGAVRIVFEPLDLRRHIALATLEVDDAIGLLVPTTAETNRDATGVVAAALLALAFGKRLDRLALVELAAIDDHQLP